MLWLYIILGFFAFLIVLAIIALLLAIMLHKTHFEHRYQSDSRITYYTKEEFGLNFEEVTVPMDEIMLRGGLYSYPNYDDKKLIILNHGMWSGVPAYLQDIEYFAKKGYLVLAINHEGTDESDGKSIRGLANSLRCLDYVIKYVKTNDRLKGKDLYVVGHSWGGFATLNIPYYHKDIKGILAIAPFVSVKVCAMSLFPKIIWPVIPFFLLIERIYVGKYAKANALKTLKDFKGNIVIMHSENDRIVKFLYNTCKLMKQDIKNASYLIVKDKDHNPHYSYSAIDATRKYYKETHGMNNDELTEYMKSVNFHEMGKLDEEILDRALDFLMGGCNGRE